MALNGFHGSTNLLTLSPYLSFLSQNKVWEEIMKTFEIPLSKKK